MDVINIDNNFYKVIPFTKEIINKIYYQKGTAYVKHGDSINIIRILDIDINAKKYSTVAIMQSQKGEDIVLQISDSGEICGSSDVLYFCKITEFKTYENFIPSPYQACVVKNSEFDEWHIEVCRTCIKGKPIFFSNTKIYKAIPLCETTEPIIGSTISWKGFVINKVNKNYLN